MSTAQPTSSPELSLPGFSLPGDILPEPTPAEPLFTVSDLATTIGGIPLSRVCFSPPPGTATQEDLIRLNDGEGHHYELIHGTLGEKAMGSWEGFVATWIATQFHIYLMSNEIGAAFGDNVPLVFSPKLVYIPDAGFISASRLSSGRPPEERPLLEMVPNLAVEVNSVSNTRREMERKLESYFSCGVEEVWYVYPKLLQVYQFVAGKEPRILDLNGVLESELVPGFRLAVKTLFSPPGFRQN